MEIKFKILSVNSAMRSAKVQFYTSELVATHPAKLQEKIAMVRASRPADSDAEIRAYAEQAWPCGAITEITFYQDVIPSGEALNQFIVEHAPWAWLKLMSDVAMKGPGDLSAICSCIGEERSTVLVLPQLQPQQQALPGEMIAAPDPTVTTL